MPSIRPSQTEPAVIIRQVLFLCLGLALNGCAVRNGGAYHLVRADSHSILLPPGIVRSDVARRTFDPGITKVSVPCPPSAAVALGKSGNHLRATVTPAALATEPPGWIREWTNSLEAAGCIPAGAGPELARQIAESVPLDPTIAFRLLHANLIDLAPGTRVQVVSPVLRKGTSPDVELYQPVQTAASGGGLNLTLKASPDLLGRETDLYEVRARSNAAGVSISPLSAEQRILDETTVLSAPTMNYFRFPPSAAFYRLFYKGSESGFTALILAAPTYAELNQRMAKLDNGVASCERAGAQWCAAIPKLVAFNIVLPAQVNGAETSVRFGATVGEVIRGTGERHPESVLSQLNVWRNYQGRQVPVRFDRTSAAILELPLLGGEAITWK